MSEKSLLDYKGTKRLLEKVKKIFSAKQDKISGERGRLLELNTDLEVKTSIYPSNPNLLDNWYFIDPINQRGKTEYGSSRQYTIDRWEIVDSYLTMSLAEKRMTLTAKQDTSADGANVWQLTEFTKNDMDGSLFTYSVLDTEGNLYTCSGVPTDNDWINNSTVTDFGWISFTWRTNNPIPSLACRITLKAGVTRTFIAAKLELGDKQTLAHQDEDGNWVLNDPPPNKEVELAKCQRYYYTTNLSTGNIGKKIGIGCSQTYIASGVSFPVQMRSIPKILNLVISEWNDPNTSIVTSQISATGIDRNGFTTIYSGDGKFKQGSIYYISYEADANL